MKGEKKVAISVSSFTDMRATIIIGLPTKPTIKLLLTTKDDLILNKVNLCLVFSCYGMSDMLGILLVIQSA